MNAAGDVLLTLAAYYSLILIRSVMVSVPLIVIVRLTRRVVPDRCTWLRAWCWSIVFVAPFTGKMHFWYETPVTIGITGFLQDLLGHFPVLRLVWPAATMGLIAKGLFDAGRLRREILRLPVRMIAGRSVRVTPLAVSPFSAGLLRPQIVFPEKAFEVMNEDERKSILIHEESHICLGQLWIFAAWKLLCALLFPNILLFFSAKDLREDMEALCDRVTMKRTRLAPAEYGRLILNSHRLVLVDGPFSPATLSGEQTAGEARRRILRICAYKPYRLLPSLLLGVCCASILGGTLVFIRQASYPGWTTNALVAVSDLNGRIKVYTDEKAVADAFSWDREKLVIRREAYEKLRAEDPGDVDPEHFFVYFDGFYKMPGIGGSGQMVEADFSGEEEELILPYEWTTDFWTEFFRHM